MNAPVLRFENLTGGYGSIPIIREITGSVERGSCLCVLGRNGVGKSTLLKLLSGHLPAMSGQIALNGRDITSLAPEKRHDLGVNTGLQERPVFDGLSVKDNLTLMQSDQDLEGCEPFFDAFPVLKDRLVQLAGTLSGGERKILSFVRTLKDNAPLTLLDEPSEGVQPENIEHMANFICKHKANGQSFLVVEQHLHLAEEIADGFQVLDNGRSVLECKVGDITRGELVQQITV